MDFSQFGFKDDDNDEEDAEEKIYYSSKDEIIFLIDCSKSMLSDDFFTACMECVQTTLKNKIIQNSHDLVGVVFFGTEKSKNSNNFDHIYIYQDLACPEAQRIIDIKEMLTDGWETFEEDYGHNSNYQMSEVLWLCSFLFKKSQDKRVFQRIILFTNNDEPHTDKAAINSCRIRANDLNKTEISLELLPLQLKDQTFDINKFYKSLLTIINDDEMENLPNPSERKDELLKRMRFKERKKRVLRKVHLCIGDGVQAEVGIYRLIHSCKKPSPVHLDKRENRELKKKRLFYLNQTGEILMPQDFKFTKMFGGKTVSFEKEDITKMKMFGEPGFSLLGFQSQEDLKLHYHVKPAHFIYPEEKSMSGSTCLFSALLDRCLNRNVVPICVYVSSKTSTPEYVALLPQKETFNENRSQLMPPGFHVIYLPYAEDFRTLNFNQTPKAQDEQISLAKSFMKSLSFKYDFNNFDNPTLKHHWMNIENKVLDTESPEEFIDYTEPKYDEIARKAGEKIQTFKEEVFPKDYNSQSKAKRAAGGDSKSGPGKRALTDIDLKALFLEKKLDSLKVDELKYLMKENKIQSVSKKKKDLIDAINSHYSCS
ncbi:X-ray repair cross-complementing protein 6-like [Argonauta hians]